MVLYQKLVLCLRNCFLPKQFLQKTRMERAVFLLTETDGDISLIAKSVGYDDALLFSKMFKQYYGDSPKQYRLKNKV